MPGHRAIANDVEIFSERGSFGLVPYKQILNWRFILNDLLGCGPRKKMVGEGSSEAGK